MIDINVLIYQKLGTFRKNHLLSFLAYPEDFTPNRAEELSDSWLRTTRPGMQSGLSRPFPTVGFSL